MIDLTTFDKQKTEGTAKVIKVGDNYMLVQKHFDSTNGSQLSDIVSSIALQEYRDELNITEAKLKDIKNFINYCESIDRNHE